MDRKSIYTAREASLRGDTMYPEPANWLKQSYAAGNDLATTIAVAPTADEPTPTGITVGETFFGTIDPADDVDYLALQVVAGQTYSVSLRGTGETPVSDTFVVLYDQGLDVVNFDDDGGAFTNSLLTFTATYSGTYYIAAQAFTAPGQTAGAGDYRVDVQQEGPDAVPDTFAGAQAIAPGDLVFGFIDAGTGPVSGLSELDTYKIVVEAGKYYTLTLAGGADYATDYLDVPAGELDTLLFVYDADGNAVAFNDDIAFPSDISSRVSFLATTSGTYYIDAAAYAGQTGGYTLEVNEVDIATLDPVDSIDWVSSSPIEVDANNVATVYFAAAGENFGERGDDGGPAPSFGWNAYEIGQVMLALEQFTTITGITYQVTSEEADATFRLYTTTSTQFGAYFYPNDPAYGTQIGIGAFNVDNLGWDPEAGGGLEQGGFAFAVILHEFGHGHGLSHPHDNGGGSEIMLGVTGPDSRGIYDLNQQVYTVMSYNDGWETHPDVVIGANGLPVGYRADAGWAGTLSPFDIAALQRKYGVTENATGNDVYEIRDQNAEGTYYQTIYDTGGTDEIRYTGVRDARIDLLAATLDYTPTGGGVVSFVRQVLGGYTIANGVVVENATGGNGNDVILGNAAANLLIGNAGNDTMMGREGADTLRGGKGNDTLMGGDGNDVLDGGVGADTIAGDAGDDRILYDAADVSVSGGAGIDTLVLTEAVLVDLGASSQIAGKAVTGFENVDASTVTGAVTLIGTAVGNSLIGGAGNDTIRGGKGVDVLKGNGGNDRIIGGAGADSINGGDGDDTIVYDSADTDVVGGAGNDTLGLITGETVNLGAARQIAGRYVIGFENVDAADATAAVQVTGSSAANKIVGGSGVDTLFGGDGDDSLDGGIGNDTLVGGLGNDSLSGGAGNDRIAFDGFDTFIRGDLGADTFILDPAGLAGGRARILDFSSVQGDKIDLGGIDAIAGGADNAFAFIGTSSFGNVAGQLRYTTSGTGSLVQGDINGDGIADFSFFVSSGTLTQTDFLL